MFIKLTHGLHMVLNAIVSYIQKWTDDSVPEGTRTLHNFKDGLGKRPAVPLDELNNGNNIVSVSTDSKFGNSADNVAHSENILRTKLITELGAGSDDLSNGIGINNVECNPNPIIFEISNEVPDKIEKIVPIKTQALPGQDFIFQIFYVKDYNYIEGDIMPVFGSWGNYARLSRDGKYLSVNSYADLTVRLILTPAPQDWIPEQPDPSIIQQPGDRMLNTIPRDGAKSDFTIEEMKIENNFYNVTIENQATTFVTNGEFSNGKYYNVSASTNKINIPMTFSEGFDKNAIYWKCYDDPKSTDPATGYYPTKDYNEEFGPLPDGFRKLQYITPNNSAYMDLGIKLKKDYKVKILMNLTENTSNNYIGLFGARNSTDTDFYNDNHTNGAYACYVKYNYRTIGLQRGSHRYFTSNNDYPEGSIRWFYSTGTSFEYQNYDGTVVRRITAAASENIDTEWNCFLFTVNDKGNPYAYGAYGNLYRFEMWDENDNLIMRLIPAKNLDTNSCGLYDIVNNKFYYNKRPMGYFSGPEFYIWQKPIQCSDHNVRMYLENNNDIDYNEDYDLPDGYEKLYEIYSKERRLDTGYKIKKDDRVECCATVDNNTGSNYRVLFGSRQSSFSDDNYFFFTRFNGQNIACYGKNAKETQGTTMTYGEPCKFVAEPYKLSCYDRNNIQKWEINVNSGTPVDCRYNCYLGCGNNSNSIDSWCYAHYHYFRVYDKDDNLVVNLIPAKRLSDNVLGFYDTVRNAFYTSNSGNYNYESKSLHNGEKRILHIENISKDINLGIIRNPVYDNPFKLEDCIEDEHQHQPTDSLTYAYEITDSKILDYFYYVEHVNNATDYATLDSTYKTANVGNPVSFTVTYKSGYDNYDIKCTANTDATVTIGKTHYITYNELDIPAEYTPVKGLYSNNSSTYFKTGYIPKWNDRVECYCSITRDSYYTYPSYVFGTRTGVNNKSFVFYAHRNAYDNRYRMGYDRCCGETDIREIINNELMKITADNNGCECDFAHTKTKINTQMPPLPKSEDYNPDITLPVEYEKMSSVGNESTSYGDLGFMLTAHDKVEVCTTLLSGTNTYEVIYGARTASGGNHCYCVWTRYSNNNTTYYGRGGSYSITSTPFNKPVKLITKDSFIGLYNVDNSIIYEKSVSTSLSDTQYNCYIFGLNTAGSLTDNYCKAYVHYFKVYNNDNELIHYFVPALRKADNVPGFYDTITNNYIVSKSSTPFAYIEIDTEDKYPDCEYEMYLFGCNNANSRQYGYYGNMYKFTIYNGDNQPVVNMVPVKRISDNVLGFYDTIRQIFITPAAGSVTEAAEPVYKGNIVVSNIPNDTRITITKNDDSRKTLILEEGIEDEQYHQPIDQLEYNYELKNTELIDWFYTVKYINNTISICSVQGEVATYYNVPRVGSNTRFPITYNVGLDDNMIEATATAGATVEIAKPIEIIYNHFPDEYIEIYGLRNTDTNTYFEIPYTIKSTDTVKLWVTDEKNSYTYYIFGSATNETTDSCLLCSKYEYSSNNMFYSRNKRVNISGPANEVLEITCEPNKIDYTNGYNDYLYNLDNTPTNCIYPFHVFGAYHRGWSGYHAASFTGTIYKLTIYDDFGIKVNLVPVKRKVDGMLGFYDTVGDTFYIPTNGSVTQAPAPKLKGKIVVSNITDDTDVIIITKTQPATNIDETDSITYSYNLEGCSLTDYWHYITVNNTTNGELTFTNAVYGGNCYTCLHDNNITMPCSFKSGRVSTDFIVSDGTLTNNGLVLNNVKDDKTITVMLNDYHNPKSDTDDDLNIFTDPDFSGYNQYRIVNGTDLMLTSYSFINSQPASMTDRHVFEFNIGDIDLLAFNPNNIPGDRVKARIITSDSNMNEVVQNITVDGKLMYKHTITLRNQVKLENGKVYIFKVRDNTDTGKLIAYAKDTGPINLVNSNNEYTVEGSDIYFNWNESNKYIVQGNKNIYFELNGIKL